MSAAESDVTRLLARLNQGESAVFERVLELVYDELKVAAERCLRRERRDHTLQPTALVHEVYLKLVGQEQASFSSRAHFLAVAATAMRRVLVNHALARATSKRGGGAKRVTLATDDGALAIVDEEIVALDEALTRLARLDERKAKVVDLRYFAGLSVDATAEALGVAPATVKRDFEFARVWLLREIRADD